MEEQNTEVLETIFNKCPICKKGKVQQIKKKTTLGIIGNLFLGIPNTTIFCITCKAEFIPQQDKEEEKTYKLDLSQSSKESNYKGQTLKISEWKRGMSDLDYCIHTNTLPKTKVIGLSIILQPNEVTHWYSQVSLLEERAVRHSGGGAVRVAKGVYIGGGRSESHGELRVIDHGDLLLTNQRLVFNGSLRTQEYPLTKIISIQEFKDSFEIGCNNRKKVQVFKVDEPTKWTGYVRIAIQNTIPKSKKRK